MRPSFYAIVILLLLIAGTGPVRAAQPAPTLRPQNMRLPGGSATFPGTDAGARATNAYCLMCHSADMVMNQPSLTAQTWLAEVNKMKNVFKAPIPPEQVPVIADYLARIKGPK